MCLTANMRLIGSSHLINGCKIKLGGTSAITGTILQAWQRVKSVLGERHSWPSHLQTDLAAVSWGGTNLGVGGGQHP